MSWLNYVNIRVKNNKFTNWLGKSSLFSSLDTPVVTIFWLKWQTFSRSNYKNREIFIYFFWFEFENIWVLRQNEQLNNALWPFSLCSDILQKSEVQWTFWYYRYFFKQKCKTFLGSSFLNVQICCFSLSFMVVNDESLDCWFDQRSNLKR